MLFVRKQPCSLASFHLFCECICLCNIPGGQRRIIDGTDANRARLPIRIFENIA